MPSDQPSLFQTKSAKQPASRKNAPLAARLRPRSFDELVGHEGVAGPDSLLRKLIESSQISSLFLYGPPGCGKTTLAELIASSLGCYCVRINAVLSNVAELRDILKLARYREEKTLLFIDEIHRFNRAQQDLLLPDVETGNIILIGATTQNPSFYIIPPLLSRSHLIRLDPLETEDLVLVLKNALQNEENGLGSKNYSAADDILKHIATLSNGDARQALSILETLTSTLPFGREITQADLESFLQARHLRFDARSDDHYDTISAFIKSIRGSDPDAALYWLAVMLEGGEDPRFIARRLFILASEDVGLADPRALPMASAAFQACEVLGMPECGINLAHVTVFLATSPKSNTAYAAYNKALAYVKKEPRQAVPPWLKDGNTKTSRSLGYGDGYIYSHDVDQNISGQNYTLEPVSFFDPKKVGAENSIAERLEYWKQLKVQRAKDQPS